MAELDEVLRVTVSLTGWSGAPGSNTFLFGDQQNAWKDDDVDSVLGWVGAYYNGMKPWLLEGVQYRVLPFATVFDAATGDAIRDIDPGAAARNGVGESQGSALSRAVCMYIYHRSDQYADGRKIRGGAYIGPLGADALDEDGQLVTSLTVGQRFAWEDDPPPGNITHAVWRRPIKDKDGQIVRVGRAFDTATPVATNGPPAMLRSRRD